MFVIGVDPTRRGMALVIRKITVEEDRAFVIRNKSSPAPPGVRLAESIQRLCDAGFVVDGTKLLTAHQLLVVVAAAAVGTAATGIDDVAAVLAGAGVPHVNQLLRNVPRPIAALIGLLRAHKRTDAFLRDVNVLVVEYRGGRCVNAGVVRCGPVGMRLLSDTIDPAHAVALAAVEFGIRVLLRCDEGDGEGDGDGDGEGDGRRSDGRGAAAAAEATAAAAGAPATTTATAKTITVVAKDAAVLVAEGVAVIALGLARGRTASVDAFTLSWPGMDTAVELDVVL